MAPTENGKIRALKLKRETLRELDAGELKQAQGGARRTYSCEISDYCTRGCAASKRC
jgi:hypothetical protein